MRRIHPNTLQRLAHRTPKLARRTFTQAAISSYPRSGPFKPPPPKHEFVPEVFEDSLDDVTPPNGSSQPIQPFESVITSVETPKADEPLPADLRTLHHHVLTAFLPANQPLSPAKPASTDQAARPRIVLPGMFEPEEIPFDQPTAPVEPILALVSPFEGGRHYVYEAVQRIAAETDADLLRFDLALGIGLGGPGSPLAKTGPAPPALSQSSNPLFAESRNRAAPSPPVLPLGMPEEDLDDAEDDHEHRSAIVVTPLANRLPIRPSAKAESASAREDWVAFFDYWLNQSSSTKKRIILLESVEAMSSTFDEWWPSFEQVVRARRTKDGLNVTNPTTVIFSSSPSLLLPHTSPVAATAKDQESAASSIHPMLQEIADRLGGSVETRVENHDSNPLWWGSEETDTSGRTERDARRLSALLDDAKGSKSFSRPRHPILDMISGAKQEESPSVSIVRKVLAIVPSERDRSRELYERLTTRSLINAALVNHAVQEMGAELRDPVEAAHIIRVTTSTGKNSSSRLLRIEGAYDPQLKDIIDNRHTRISKSSYQNAVKSAISLRQLATTAVGQKLSTDADPTLSWQDIIDAARSEAQGRLSVAKRIRSYMPTKRVTKLLTNESNASTDNVVAQLKKNKDLSAHERRLLSCIVDTSKLTSTTFDQVHLPYKTIDGIRTIISLPLLFPDAFRGGVLRDHSTTGALLFGPPGTGKTLLARAVANESGARMLAIQPSDVNDKYFGEGEKLVKAVFSLARRLSPCVIFLDEVDALFGARSARGSGSGHKAHDQLLTEFMQEMDGLSSAGVNKDKRVVVIGATNRPFDLDDAVLRRLPRRLLVDLPGPDDRKAILNILLREENLDADVDIDGIVKETEGFSGSDLKHLCVSAALAAVKDSVKVPWEQKPAGGIQQGGRSTAPVPSSGSVSNIVIERDSQPAETLTTTVAAAGSVTAQVPLDSSKPHIASNGSVAEDEASNSVEALVSESGDKVSNEEGQIKDDSASVGKTSTIDRILGRKHFDIALAEIRPSSSEEGSLPELRKWAAQYGEGGSERGRKKGFGKGFGFGDAKDKKTRDTGYGKVASDD